MGYPNSIEEIDNGLLHEGIDKLEGFELAEYKFKQQLSKEQKIAAQRESGDYGYWLDNCGDGEWYCSHCLQPECSKRLAKCRKVREE